MRHDILVPRVSESAEEGVLVTWFVEPGAWIGEGDLVAEVQVEKTSAEVRATMDGRIAELLVEPGAVIVQGHPIATLDAAEGLVERVGAPSVASPAASPAARRLALELGVDLASVAGTGPRGRCPCRRLAPWAVSSGP